MQHKVCGSQFTLDFGIIYLGNSYNGYIWKQREEILRAEKRLARHDPRLAYLQSKGPCAVCADPGNPDFPHTQWHSEDYSRPFLFSPPASFIVCNVCHLRLHKRFPDECGSSDWKVFLAHLRSGGYGREFAAYPRKWRLTWQAQIDAGEIVVLPLIRQRKLTDQEWWQTLSLDPESLEAPWARPRHWRERPSTSEYKVALELAQPNSSELALMRAHASFPRRCATMRQLAGTALSSSSPSQANLMYGKLAHRLSDALALTWTPEKREDGSPMWMTTIAEGWQPKEREYEWVMVPSLALLFTGAVTSTAVIDVPANAQADTGESPEF